MKTNEQMRKILRAACNKAGSQSAFAKAHGVSPQYVGSVLMGDKEMSAKIGKALGYKKTRYWVNTKQK